MHTTQNNAEPEIGRPLTETAHRRSMNRVGSMGALVSASNPTTAGQRMVHRRFQMGLTQAQVSAKVRLQSGKALSRNTYCMYEMGKYEPRLKLIEQIAAALNVSPGWLAFGTDDSAGITSNLCTPLASMSVSYRWSGLDYLPPRVGEAKDLA